MSRGKSEQSLVNYDKRLLRICQCPQSVYLDENLLPTKDAVNSVRNGTLYITKDENGFSLLHDEDKEIIIGQEYSMFDLTDRVNNAEIENKEPVVKDLSKVLVIDTETTGFSAGKDELLQVSIIDGTGKTLFNSLIKPDHNTEWKGAMIKNHISPRMVADKPSIKDVASEIQKILDSADMYVSYNGRFDVNFLEAAGIVLKNKPHLDVIKPAASVTKIPERENDRRAVDGYHYPKLEEAAKAIGYGFKAHNALNDTKATLEVAKSIYGENLG